MAHLRASLVCSWLGQTDEMPCLARVLKGLLRHKQTRLGVPSGWGGQPKLMARITMLLMTGFCVIVSMHEAWTGNRVDPTYSACCQAINHSRGNLWHRCGADDSHQEGEQKGGELHCCLLQLVCVVRLFIGADKDDVSSGVMEEGIIR